MFYFIAPGKEMPSLSIVVRGHILLLVLLKIFMLDDILSHKQHILFFLSHKAVAHKSDSLGIPWNTMLPFPAKDTKLQEIISG